MKKIFCVCLVLLFVYMPTAHAAGFFGDEYGDYRCGGIKENEESRATTPYDDLTRWYPDPDGSQLTPIGGVNFYFDQKETYYNLDMSELIDAVYYGWAYWNCDREGRTNIDYCINCGGYWVRDDGVKMFGPYVIIAANLECHPRGSIVPTSKGLAIVLDTGDFAEWSLTWVDIAVDWTI
jgi:hypothetical protein